MNNRYWTVEDYESISPADYTYPSGYVQIPRTGRIAEALRAADKNEIGWDFRARPCYVMSKKYLDGFMNYVEQNQGLF